MPSGVAFVSMGTVAPKPRVVSRAPSMPIDSSCFFMASARRRDNSMFAWAVPALSVWPSISSRTSGFAFRKSVSWLMNAMLSGFISALFLSKVMAWVAFDRAIKSAERFGLPGPVDRWKQLCKEIHADVCAHGFDRERNAFMQAYGSSEMDASVLMIPLVGFLPADDPRVVGLGRLLHAGLGLRTRLAQLGARGRRAAAGSLGPALCCCLQGDVLHNSLKCGLMSTSGKVIK